MFGPRIVYKLDTRRTKLSRYVLGLGLVAVTLLNANCGSFQSTQALNASVDTTAAATSSGDSQVWIPPTATPTPVPTATPEVPEATPSPTPVAMTSLKVMTYNIQGIPCLRDSAVRDIGEIFGVKKCPLVNNVWTKANRERIANLIINIQTAKNAGDEPDVILLQEAFTATNDLFDDDDVLSIPARTGYPYFAWGPAPKIANGMADYWNLVNQDLKSLHGLLSSGLLILSKYPIVSTKLIEYGEICTIDDCHANKGAIFAKLHHPAGFTVDIVNSHWQAGTANDAIRGMQANLYSSFVSSHRASPVLIAGGDFNFRYPNTSPQANVLSNEMGLTHAGSVCDQDTSVCQIPEGTDKARVAGNNLDHFFYKLDSGMTAQPKLGWMPLWTFSGGLLSDHLPFIMNLDLYY